MSCLGRQKPCADLIKEKLLRVNVLFSFSNVQSRTLSTNSWYATMSHDNVGGQERIKRPKTVVSQMFHCCHNYIIHFSSYNAGEVDIFFFLPLSISAHLETWSLLFSRFEQSVSSQTERPSVHREAHSLSSMVSIAMLFQTKPGRPGFPSGQTLSPANQTPLGSMQSIMEHNSKTKQSMILGGLTEISLTAVLQASD